MDISSWAFFLALAACVLALISTAVALGGRRGNVRQLALDVAELYDRVDHWQRRDRVRKLRDGQEKAAQAEQQQIEPHAPLSKAELRAMYLNGGHLPGA